MKTAVILLAALALWTAYAAEDQVPVARADDESGRFWLGGGTYTIGGLLLTNTLTTTKTTYITVSSTATTATVISCIPTSLLASTTACRRRRGIFEDSGLDLSQISAPQSDVAASIVPELKREESAPEIHSSVHDDADIIESGHHTLQKRAIYSYSTFYVTSTVTTYSFTSTTYTKTLNIATTSAVLICLPSGISTC